MEGPNNQEKIVLGIQSVMMNTENAVPLKRKETVNSVGDLLEGGVTTGIRRSAIYVRKLASLILIEPPYTESYVRWCERTEVNHLLLLDFFLWYF